jgi:hypothetical protein
MLATPGEGLVGHAGAEPQETCRDFIRREAIEGRLPIEVSRIGRWWNRDNSVEVDIVGLRGREVVLAGSVKWSRSAGAQELRALRRAAEALPDRAEHVHLALFAREQIREIDQDVLGFTAEDLYRD